MQPENTMLKNSMLPVVALSLSLSFLLPACSPVPPDDQRPASTLKEEGRLSEMPPQQSAEGKQSPGRSGPAVGNTVPSTANPGATPAPSPSGSPRAHASPQAGKTSKGTAGASSTAGSGTPVTGSGTGTSQGS